MLSSTQGEWLCHRHYYSVCNIVICSPCNWVAPRVLQVQQLANIENAATVTWHHTVCGMKIKMTMSICISHLTQVLTIYAITGKIMCLAYLGVCLSSALGFKASVPRCTHDHSCVGCCFAGLHWTICTPGPLKARCSCSAYWRMPLQTATFRW